MAAFAQNTAQLSLELLTECQNNESGDNVEVIDKLLKAGANINVQDASTNWTPLICACFSNKEEIALRLLKENNVNVNNLDKEGLSALFWAAKHCSARVVSELLSHGCDVNNQDKHGMTALFAAVGANKEENVCALLKHPDINVGLVNMYGGSCLHHTACLGDNVRIGKMLVDKCNDLLWITDYSGKKPIHVAATQRHPNLYSFFVRAMKQMNPKWCIDPPYPTDNENDENGNEKGNGNGNSNSNWNENDGNEIGSEMLNENENENKKESPIFDSQTKSSDLKNVKKENSEKLRLSSKKPKRKKLTHLSLASHNSNNDSGAYNGNNTIYKSITNGNINGNNNNNTNNCQTPPSSYLMHHATHGAHTTHATHGNLGTHATHATHASHQKHYTPHQMASLTPQSHSNSPMLQSMTHPANSANNSGMYNWHIVESINNKDFLIEKLRRQNGMLQNQVERFQNEIKSLRDQMNFLFQERDYLKMENKTLDNELKLTNYHAKNKQISNFDSINRARLSKFSNWINKTVGLPMYLNNLIENGFDDMSIIVDLTENDLKECKIELKGHRKRILKFAKLFDNNNEESLLCQEMENDDIKQRSICSNMNRKDNISQAALSSPAPIAPMAFENHMFDGHPPSAPSKTTHEEIEGTN